MKHNRLVLLIALSGAVVAASQIANARDLVEAAQSAQSMFNRIGVAAVGIGLTLGGILFAVGASQMGRNVIVSGLVGACAILGAPALVNLIGRIFGVGM